MRPAREARRLQDVARALKACAALERPPTGKLQLAVAESEVAAAT